MSGYTTEEKLDFLAGQIRALSGAVQVLLIARPDAQQCLKGIDNLLGNLVERSFGEALTDAHEEGISDVREKLANAVAISQKHRK